MSDTTTSDIKIKKINITQEVAEYIGGKIDSGEWPEGSKIESESQLSKKLGVSRVSVRSAISQFIALGRLESIQGKGTFVLGRNYHYPSNLFTFEDNQNIRKIMQFRVTIEQDTAYYAAEDPDEQDILFLRDNISQMIIADKKGDTALSWDLDMKFHKKLASMTKNEFYSDTLDRLFNVTYDLHFKVIEKLGTRFANYFHPAILDAIEAHDQEKARAQMRAHLEDFIERIGDAQRRKNALPAADNDQEKKTAEQGQRIQQPARMSVKTG